jgi:filamentous hemagglutinin family protein
VPNVSINGINSDRIDGGAIRGSNLFHSFQEFNIDNGRGAYFANPENISNILSRVTGNNLSNILGTLGVLGNANLFLINPNGIVFGPNARLDVGGSFFASTADGILFENGVEFAASNPDAPPLLTINIPIGLQLRSNPGNIQVKSAQLGVPNGKTLAFVGGDINLNQGTLVAQDGRVELGSVNGGIVGIEQNRLNIPANLQRSNIVLRDNARIEVSGTGRGTINIFARNLSIYNSETALKVGISQNHQSSGVSTPGDIQLNATESVIITNSQVFNRVDSGGVGNGGKIIIRANNLSMKEGAALDSRVIGSGSNNERTAGQGNAGAVILEVTGAVHLDRSFINTNIGTNTIGNSGDINIQAGSLFLSNSSQLNTVTSGGSEAQPSKAGNVTINVQNGVNILEVGGANAEALTGIFTTVGQGAVGQGGNIEIQAGSLSLNQGAIDSRVQGSGANNEGIAGVGNAGAVIIAVTEAVHLDRSFINTNIGTNAIGNSGNINIQAGSLLMRGGSQLNSNTSGGNFEQPSQAGEVRLNIRNRLNLEGLGTDTDPAQQTKITTEVDNGGIGEAGSVKIEVTNGSFLMNNGAALVTRVRRAHTDENTGEILTPAGQGNGGDVNLNVRDNIIFENNSLILATVGDEVLGTRSGNVNIESNAVYLNNSSRIITATGGSPNALQTPSEAGNISLQVSDLVHLNQSQIISSATPRATRTNGGNITINTPSMLLEDSAVTAGDGTLNPAEENSAGQIIINAPNFQLNTGILQADTQRGRTETASITVNSQDLRLQNQSYFTTNANETDGGNITINAETLVSLNNSDITANADGGAGGAILINAEGIWGATPLTRQQVEERLGEQQIQGNPRFSQDLLQTTSDIVAISTTDAALSGTVELNTEIDTSSGLIDLSQTVVDPNDLIAQEFCRQRGGSEFVVTGKGGIAADPYDKADGNQIEVDLVEPVPSQPRNTSQKRSEIDDNQPISSLDIVPARGWIRDENGDVILVSYDPTKTGVRRQPMQHPQCQP